MLLTIPRAINGDLYVYYELDNFYQNYNRYKKSYDSDQLSGVTAEGTCDVSTVGANGEPVCS